MQEVRESASTDYTVLEEKELKLNINKLRDLLTLTNQGSVHPIKGNSYTNILQLHNGNHHHHKIKYKIYTSNNNRKQKLQSLNIRVSTASKQRLTLK